MIPVNWLPLVKYGLIGVLLAGLGFGCYQQGKKAVQLEWDASRAKLAEERSALILAHAQELEKLGKRQQEINQEVSESYDKALAEVRKNHATELARVRASGGLRLPGSICASSTTGQAQAESPSGHNESPPATVALPERVTEGLFDIVEKADEVSEQLRSCQAWIKEQGFY